MGLQDANRLASPNSDFVVPPRCEVVGRKHLEETSKTPVRLLIVSGNMIMAETLTLFVLLTYPVL